MQNKQASVYVVFIILIVLFAGSTYIFYKKYRAVAQNPQKVVQEQITSLLDEIGQLIVLPQGETPTVATVSDLSKLKDQPFFVNAKIGDKVLIYTNARKAILYSPSEHKIIEVAPLTIGQPQVQTPPPPAPAPAPSAPTSTKPTPTTKKK